MKKWIKSNLNVICMLMFLISIILSCFNLFTRLNNIILTIITFIILGVGYGIMIYDNKHKDKVKE